MTTRRTALTILAGGVPAWKLARAADELPRIAAGPFQATRESLPGTASPTGFATPSSASGRIGDRSPRPRPATGTPATCTFRAQRQYDYHVKTYGHPSKFGFKDVIATWKAAKFDPDH